MKLKEEAEFRKEFIVFLTKFIMDNYYYSDDDDLCIDDDLVEEAIDAYEAKTGRKVCICNEK